MPTHLAFKKTIWTIADWLFPAVCVGCGEPGEAICDVCKKSILRIPAKHCRLCSKPIYSTEVCKFCRNNPPEYDKFYAYAIYTGLVRKSIHRLKYKRDLGMGRLLAELIYSDLIRQFIPVDLVIPMPLSKERMKMRGYNQAAAITGHFCELSNWHHAPKALLKIRNTESQVHLTVEERMANLDGAFEADETIVRGKRVLIVDDVFTTGATMRQATKALKAAGASTVYAATIARALLTQV